MKIRKLKVYADGGARGNPGPAAAGYVITDGADSLLEEGGEYLGETTNNQAEYRAIELALNKALNYKPDQVDCFFDSQLVANQLNGLFKIKKAELKPRVEAVKQLTAKFPKIIFTHVGRGFNKQADYQVNKILDQHK